MPNGSNPSRATFIVEFHSSCVIFSALKACSAGSTGGLTAEFPGVLAQSTPLPCTLPLADRARIPPGIAEVYEPCALGLAAKVLPLNA